MWMVVPQKSPCFDRQCLENILMLQCQTSKEVKNDVVANDLNSSIHCGWTALLVAADFGNTDHLKLLLQYGSDPYQRLDGKARKYILQYFIVEITHKKIT